MHKRRIDWLKKHRRLWTHYDQALPGSFQIERLLLDKMKAVGLYPVKTTILDVNLGNMIYKIRNTGRPKKLLYKSSEDN